ncbi:MAG: DUF262 domain-containing protein [Deltaproteobacteria bacterium]|jgi:hypothetical protein|nr:DUF262 domain-containing protein [Deltaproteobacteria bacterium]
MTVTLETNNTPVTHILERIRQGKIQLPDFQRGWVWDDLRIRALISSVSSSFPVGALMFLSYGGDDCRFWYRPFSSREVEKGIQPEELVLDGQQRLTALYNAMYSREPVSTSDARQKGIERYYYFDMEKCVKSLDDKTFDRLDAVVSLPPSRILNPNSKSGDELDLSSREREYEARMFPANIVFDGGAKADWMYGFLGRNIPQKEEDFEFWKLFDLNILAAFSSYSIPVIRLGKDTSKAAVCQMFENVNTGGVSLSVFELVTASFAAFDYDLRRDWFGKIDDSGVFTEGRLQRTNAKEDVKGVLSVVSEVDFLVALTLVSRYEQKIIKGDEAPAVSCKRYDVLNLTLDEYKKYADDLTDAFVKAAVFLLERCIYSKHNLPYSSQLIPLAALFCVLKNRAEEKTVRDKLSRWFWCGVFGEMYGAANETRYANDITGFMNYLKGRELPDTVERANFDPARLLSLQSRNSAAYKGVTALILQAGARDFISGKKMDFTLFSDETIDIHHIFPKRYCDKKGYDSKKYNSIVNKTPLSSLSNRIIGGNAPSVYLKEIEKKGKAAGSDVDNFVSSHLIDVDDLRKDDFDGFFIKRAEALLSLIAIAMGKPVAGLDGRDLKGA